jgi:protein AbiQ
MRLYSISDDYIEYLRKVFPRVYSNKITNRTHTRKYLGVVFKLNDFNYYIPLSSPKDAHDYITLNGKKVIRKDSIIVIRMVVKGTLKGTLQIGTMIPVPDKALIQYNLQDEQDISYKELVQDEIIFIRKNANRIVKTAKLLYSKKTKSTHKNPVIDRVLDFKSIEEYSIKWQ